jgi:hypothetical protein
MCSPLVIPWFSLFFWLCVFFAISRLYASTEDRAGPVGGDPLFEAALVQTYWQSAIALATGVHRMSCRQSARRFMGNPPLPA